MSSADFNPLPSRDARRGVHDFLSGGSEMAARMRAFDWQETPLGDPAHWPQSLRTATDILLNSRYPMFLAWGPKLALLYNDGYRPIFGNKDPAALGQPFPEVWAEIWDDIVPLVERALAGEATWSEDLRLFMERRGFPEEVYFTFSYSPVRDDDGAIAGMFCACTETTGKVLGERRLKTLRDLAATTGDARSVTEVCRLSAGVIASNAADVPFALLYLHENDGATARLAANVGCTAGERFSPEIIAVGPQGGHRWPAAPLLGVSRLVLTDLDETSGLPGTPWPEPSTTALILPLARSGQARLRGCLVVGASRRLPFDDHYERFFDLLAGGVATALANVDEYEAERRRAEALAEIDRAKTAFFSNVSHELRTPLTLMLGPLEDVLSSADELGGTAREQLRLAHRNAIRLLKLVNSLLDFSRIEARRVQVSYESTDLAGLTADLASNFRSACEKAGLELCVICPPLPEPIYVDRDMWE
ncbi:MAG: histidine kinase dimerization/phospho-acceptor domain-containing protein, partial [Woeseiaceae bacterium]